MAVLPAKAPATPARPRKVLVLGYVAGFAHSSLPLAAKTLEEMGKKTGAWTADITYDPAKITAENLKQYDALVLDEHDRHLPRRPQRPGRHRRPPQGAARVRARRQGPGRHPCRNGLLSRRRRRRRGAAVPARRSWRSWRRTRGWRRHPARARPASRRPGPPHRRPDPALPAARRASTRRCGRSSTR